MKHLLLTICLSVSLMASAAVADWSPCDGHKMHWPQLPDPQGWDVFASTYRNANYDPNDPAGQEFLQKVLADDWMCSGTGPVSDVHLWGSWRDNVEGPIDGIQISIHGDIPATADSYSRPGELLWERNFTTTEIKIINPYGTGNEGWFNPNTGLVVEEDHDMFHQINIMDIVDPFIQKEGDIYWLDVTVFTSADAGAVLPEWGWKTSMSDHFNDDAVWSDIDAAGGLAWNELRDPLDPAVSLDMAFVITPEPATMVMLALGSLTLLCRGRKT